MVDSVLVEVLSEIAGKSDDPFVLSAVGRLKVVPSRVLSMLSRVDSSLVLAAVAGNVNADQDVLSMLSGDNLDVVVCAVASNPSCPTDVLNMFSRSADVKVLAALASNPGVSSEFLSGLLASVDVLDGRFFDVGYKAASNPRLSAADFDRLVSFSAGVPSQAAVGGFKSFDQALAASPVAPPDFLRSAALSVNPSVRFAVASNVRTPVDVLAVLADDFRDLFVVRAALANPFCPADVLMSAVYSSDDSVKAAVAANPAVPSAAVEVLSVDPSVQVRLELASNFSVSDAVRAKLLLDPVSYVAVAAAQFPGVVPDVHVSGVVSTVFSEISDPVKALLLGSLAYSLDDILGLPADPGVSAGSSSVSLVDGDRLFLFASSVADGCRQVSSEVFDGLFGVLVKRLFVRAVSEVFAQGLCTSAQRLTLQRAASDLGVDLGGLSSSRSNTVIRRRRFSGSGIELDF